MFATLAATTLLQVASCEGLRQSNADVVDAFLDAVARRDMAAAGRYVAPFAEFSWMLNEEPQDIEDLLSELEGGEALEQAVVGRLEVADYVVVKTRGPSPEPWEAMTAFQLFDGCIVHIAMMG